MAFTSTRLCRPNPCQVLLHTGGIQTVGRNERVDVKAMRLRVGDRFHLDLADGSGRNPGNDVLELIIRQRCALRSTECREHLRRCSPTLRMSDQSEIDLRRYTGNCATHASVISPGKPNVSSVFRYCCSDAPRNYAALKLTSNNDGFTQLDAHTSQCPSLHSFASIAASVVMTSR